MSSETSQRHSCISIPTYQTSGILIIIMKSRLLSLPVAVVVVLALPVCVAEKAQPVRMGCGIMTFDTVPGWGLGDDGKSVIGPTHGSVVIDKSGNIYTSSDLGEIGRAHV